MMSGRRNSPKYIYERSLWLKETRRPGEGAERSEKRQQQFRIETTGRTCTVLVAVEIEVDGFKMYFYTFIVVKNNKNNTIFHSGYRILHSHKQYTRILISPHSYQCLLFSAFLIVVLLMSVR